eukprot:CAMPEP_0113463444 /NCGR_PEP_ID=MMETSP0014_2-20120614/12653_1 /TAXON_ID=2857 /ORGANISM="Nitzschia sp." /LENGTH=64 /DNA_ID=CAMNT_0000355423 /DNA_START=251 /DNA_END=442 /DNA_ORIENTATION=+ /assembly_acc=CAM_ASM_000159
MDRNEDPMVAELESMSFSAIPAQSTRNVFDNGNGNGYNKNSNRIGGGTNYYGKKTPSSSAASAS